MVEEIFSDTRGKRMIKSSLGYSTKIKSSYLQTTGKQEINTKAKEKKLKEEQNIDRVVQIKEQIQSGMYKVDLKKTSEKMALNLLNL